MPVAASTFGVIAYLALLLSSCQTAIYSSAPAFLLEENMGVQTTTDGYLLVWNSIRNFYPKAGQGERWFFADTTRPIDLTRYVGFGPYYYDMRVSGVFDGSTIHVTEIHHCEELSRSEIPSYMPY